LLYKSFTGWKTSITQKQTKLRKNGCYDEKSQTLTPKRAPNSASEPSSTFRSELKGAGKPLERPLGEA